jgi:hypothetical protein
VIILRFDWIHRLLKVKVVHVVHLIPPCYHPLKILPALHLRHGHLLHRLCKQPRTSAIVLIHPKAIYISNRTYYPLPCACLPVPSSQPNAHHLFHHSIRFKRIYYCNHQSPYPMTRLSLSNYHLKCDGFH